MTCDCGRRYESRARLDNVHSLGLALLASCPHCGERLAVNALWQSTEVVDLPAEAWSPGKRAAERRKRHRQSKKLA